MNKNKFAADWLKYLIVSDHISKLLLLVSVAGLVFFGMGGFQATTMGMIFGSLLVVSLLVSLGSYLFIGKFREACVKKFYDAVGSSGDLPSEYRGRELKRIKVTWKGRRAESVHLTVSTNSRAVTSRYEWRTVKRAASENFKFVERNVLIFLEDQSSGVFRFISASDAALTNSPEVAIAISKENMYSFAYEALSSSGHTLPSIRNFDAELATDGSVKMNAVTLQFDQQLSSYDVNRFESAFNRQYQNASSQWTFEWSSSNVVITAVERGSSRERIISATKSLEMLIESASSTGLNIYGREGYSFNSKDIQWGERPIHVENFTIDFLRSDISRPDRVERFETLMEQGLKQLFPKSHWKFAWDVDAFKKAVYISKVAEVEYASQSAAVGAVSKETTGSPDVQPLDAPAPATVARDADPTVATRDSAPAARSPLPARPSLKNLPPRPPKLNL